MCLMSKHITDVFLNFATDKTVMRMETFYHGTSVLFKKFDIAHALEGDGKAKFGFGTYVTESYTSAAHYAYNKKRPENKDYYVYTLEIPDMTDDNHLFSVRHVHPSIIEHVESALGERIPEEARTPILMQRKLLQSSSVRLAWSISHGHKLRPSQMGSLTV